MDKEYTDVSVAEDTNCGYKELVEAIRFFKTTYENQVEINKILKDEIVQLIKESEMHKELIKNLFENHSHLFFISIICNFYFLVL